MPEFFVGRADELKALEAMLVDARSGAGKLALVSGEPGIGKSRLAEELTRHAEAQGCRVAWGRSWEGLGTPAYWPWTQLLRRLVTFPELVGAFEDPKLSALTATQPPTSEQLDADHARFQLHDALSKALVLAARARPLVLVLDDLHTADVATLEALHFVSRGLHGAALFVIGTARAAAFAPGADAPAMLARIHRESQHLPLQRLAEGELGEWIARAAPGLDAHAVWSTSEGNPLFVQELLAAAKARPGASWSAPMPAGIREAVRAHLALLSIDAQRSLEAASVLGREFDPAMAQGTFEEAVGSSVLHRLHDGRLRFSHILLRDELYGRLDPARRQELHRAAAKASPDRAVAAHHALLGTRPEDAASTAEVVHDAMVELSGRLAHEDAVRLGQRAIEALSEHLRPQDLCSLSVAVAEAMVTCGDLPGGQALGERAATMAADLGLPELLAKAVLARVAEVPFGLDEPATGWIRRALQALPEGDSRVRALLMGRLAATLNNSHADMTEMRTVRDGSIAMARRLGDEKALLASLNNASGMYPEELPPRARFALYSETVELAERYRMIGRVAPMLMWHVASWLELGEPEGAQAAADRIEKLLAPFPQPHYRWRPPLIHAVLAAIRGQFADAERLSRESYEISLQHRVPEGLMMYVIYRSGLPYLRGDDGNLPEVLPLVQQVMAPMPTSEVFSAIWEAPLGRVDRVRRSFEMLKVLPYHDVTGASQLGWACARAGLTEHAPFFYELAKGVSKNVVLTFGPGGFTCLGSRSFMVGQLAAMTGRREEAQQCFTEAVQIARELKSPPFIATAELAMAELLFTHDAGGAAEHARIAHDQAGAVGMSALAERAKALIGGARPTPPRPEATSTLSIRRDGELWHLEAGPRKASLRDSKGMQYLASLIQAAHTQIHVLELSGIGEEGDAGPLLDAKAKAAYRARAEELRAELEQATSFNDPARMERARDELDALGAELARALGLGGRDRRAGSAAERARINVQRRLRDVLDRIAEQDEALGRHVELSVKTGLFCMYAPTWPAR